MSNDASDSSNSQQGPDSSPRPDWDAIARYLAGESPPAEALSVKRWLDANPADDSLVQSLDTAATLEPERVDVESALKRVHSQMAKPERPKLVVDRGGAMSGIGGIPAVRRRTVALVTLAAAAAFVSIVTLQRGEESAADKAADGRTYATAVGKRDSITLSDGSRVILGPDSRLVVLGDYGKTSRSVSLTGDAYFDIKHDATKLFSVNVDRSVIEDLGTTFAVESDAGDTTNVSVLSGSVRLRAKDSAAGSGAVLSAGDRGSLAADGEVKTYPHTVADDAAWTTGRLVFKDASIARVTGELHRWYGVDLRIADTALLGRHLSASFNGDDSIDQVLKIIGLSLGATVDRQGDRATLAPVHGPAPVR